jgi:hypothetical protein
MLHKGKPPTGFLTPNHKPNPNRSKVDSFPVVGPEDAWALRDLEAMRVGSCRIIGIILYTVGNEHPRITNIGKPGFREDLLAAI